jgi:hypothetical protein
MQRWGIKSAKNHQVLGMVPPEDSLELRIRNMKSMEEQNLLTTFFSFFSFYICTKINIKSKLIIKSIHLVVEQALLTST